MRFTPCFWRRLAEWTAVVVLASAGWAGAEEQPASGRHGDWPFKPPQRPAVPAVQNQPWVVNPIDAFILARLEAEGLQPSAEADKRTLLRRVTFDLTGLPPSAAEQEAFLADTSPEAYAKVVDRLLDSPRYGERWAQHWLDVVRYAETDGFKEDALRPNAYKYRDYVIEAFNADLPYDRFVSQQLAGDELEPDNPQAWIATGLNRLYPDETNAANLRQRRQEILDNITETTGLAFLGLTMGCAQCHDHKFDQILQSDYFRLQAFFTPMLPRDDVPAATPEEQQRYREQLAVWEAASAEVRGELEAFLEPLRERTTRQNVDKFDTETQEAVHTPAAERTSLQMQLAAQAMLFIGPKMKEAIGKLKGEEKQRYEELQRRLAEFDSLKPAALPTVMAISDTGREPPATYLLDGGDFRKPLEPVEPGFPEFLGASQLQLTAAEKSTGRRSALARWLCRSDHPLTARIMMNRLWQHHFGEGIVATPNDFGAMGESPSHPELLDWLAVEFVQRGWSLKAMHRLMVTSATYRQTSLVDPDDPAQLRAAQSDAGNRLLWHARRKRLEGEAIRDAMLQVSGQLNLRMYGPSARPELPPNISNYAWKADEKPEDRNRRSIYVFAKRNMRYPLFDAFDLPDLHNSCPRRSQTITAPQALMLLNGEFSLAQARHWAGKLLLDHPSDDAALVQSAYKQAYGRQPEAEELDSAVQFVADQTARLGSAVPQGAALPDPLPADVAAPRAAAIVDFCHALLNANEFLYLD